LKTCVKRTLVYQKYVQGEVAFCREACYFGLVCHLPTSQRSASAQRLTDFSSARRLLPAARFLQNAVRKVAPSSLSNQTSMLPKRSRLSKATIEKHLIRARRIKTARFLVLYTQIPGLKGPQISVSASKKVAPTAVMRNKLRRRGYAALLPLIPTVSPTAAVLISYVVRDSTSPIPGITLEIKDILKKAGLLA
jgi:ribonuclease P protein component